MVGGGGAARCDCVPVTVLFLIMLMLGIWSRMPEKCPSLAGGGSERRHSRAEDAD